MLSASRAVSLPPMATTSGNGFPVIPKDRDFQKIEGSNEFYSFHARSEYAPTLEVEFISCYVLRGLPRQDGLPVHALHACARRRQVDA